MCGLQNRHEPVRLRPSPSPYPCGLPHGCGVSGHRALRAVVRSRAPKSAGFWGRVAQMWHRTLSEPEAGILAHRGHGAATDRPSRRPAYWQVPVLDMNEPRMPRPHTRAVCLVLRADPTSTRPGARRVSSPPRSARRHRDSPRGLSLPGRAQGPHRSCCRREHIRGRCNRTHGGAPLCR